MIKADLKKDYPLMTKNFVIYTSIEEQNTVSRIFNVANCAEASTNLLNYNLDQIKDFKELAKRACIEYSECGFRLNCLYFYLNYNFDFHNKGTTFLGSEGIFESREEYHKWQQLYGLLKPITKDN